MDSMKHYSTYQSQFIEMFYGRETTPAKEYLDDSYPGEWGSEDNDGSGVKVIRTTNFTNTGKLNLEDVVTRNIEERKVTRKQIRKFDTILERSGGTTDNPVGRVVLFEDEGLFLCNNFTQVLRFKDIDPRYAFYALYFFYQTNKTAIRSMGSKTTGIQNLNMSKYLEIGIPNATQDEQNEFVRIAEQADKSKFISLKSQFIEMFEEDRFSKYRLGDLVSIRTGKLDANASSENGEYPFFTCGVDTLKIDKYAFDCEAVLLAGNGDFCVKYYNGKFNAYQRTYVIETLDSTALSVPYLYAWLRQYANELREKAIGGIIKYIKMGDLTEALIPLPSLEEQNRYEAIAQQADKSKYIN